MDKSTLTALKVSIKHWEQNVAAKDITEVMIGSKYCALCAKFLEYACSGCPVSKQTGMGNCLGTPYTAIWQYRDRWLFLSGPRDFEEFRSLMQKELDFLRSLLPEGTE